MCQPWNNLRLTRLILHKFILDHVLPLLQITKSPELAIRVKAPRIIILQLVSDICATIPQLAGDLPYLCGDNSTQDPLRPSPIHFLSSSIPRPVPRNDDPPEV